MSHCAIYNILSLDGGLLFLNMDRLVNTTMKSMAYSGVERGVNFPFVASLDVRPSVRPGFSVSEVEIVTF